MWTHNSHTERQDDKVPKKCLEKKKQTKRFCILTVNRRYNIVLNKWRGCVFEPEDKHFRQSKVKNASKMTSRCLETWMKTDELQPFTPCVKTLHGSF